LCFVVCPLQPLNRQSAAAISCPPRRSLLSIKPQSESARALFLPVVVPLKRVELLKPMHKRNHAYKMKMHP
jgi:hypothetical protein